MLTARVSWNLKAVVSIHVLRLIMGLVLVRVLYPFLFTITPLLVEVTDRLVVVILVCLAVRQYHGDWHELGLSLKHVPRHIGQGLAAGMVLLGISLFSERLYATVLFLTPSQHPLLALVENSLSWRDLMIPLFLAGLAAPVAEEILYRLFTFLPLKERWGLWGGAFASAAIFALMHFNAYWLAELIIVGVGLALLYYQTGSLISSMVAHSFINSAKILMLFFGLPLV
ncbi:MAG TPA: type II CAAX endopeptidase family protein [Negativicutes bacterium]